jgi:hypothetical protein
MDKSERWPAVLKDDDALMDELFAILSARAQEDPYGSDGSFAAQLSLLPAGLRAMGATHWLDISLTLDSITWHFGNFGEPGLVALTEEGLLELGLQDLHIVFCEAKDLMIPLLKGRTESDGDPYQILESRGLREQADELDRRAWALHCPEPHKSQIYAAWIKYAREHPERVFEG